MKMVIFRTHSVTVFNFILIVIWICVNIIRFVFLRNKNFISHLVTVKTSIYNSLTAGIRPKLIARIRFIKPYISESVPILIAILGISNDRQNT